MVQHRSFRLVRVCGTLHVAVVHEPSERMNESWCCLSADCFMLRVMTSEELFSVIDMIMVFICCYFTCHSPVHQNSAHCNDITDSLLDNITTGKNLGGRANFRKCQMKVIKHFVKFSFFSSFD